MNYCIKGLLSTGHAKAQLQPWQGFRSLAQIHSHEETTVNSWKLGSALLCRWTRSTHIFGLVNSTYFFKITNHNQHAFNIKYLTNLIKKYWTCLRYQKMADFLVCFPPSICMQVWWPPSWKIHLRIQLSLSFWCSAVRALDNFSWNFAWLLKTIYKKFWSTDLSPRFS